MHLVRFSLLLLFSIIISPVIHAQIHHQEWDDYCRSLAEKSISKAKVKKCLEYAVPEPANKPEEGLLATEYQFYANGKLSKRLKYGLEDTSEWAFIYDRKDRLIEQIWKEGPEAPVLTGYSYNEKGQLQQKLISGSEPRDYSYIYNKKGQISVRIGKTAFPIAVGDSITVTWSEIERDSIRYNSKGQVESHIYYLQGTKIGEYKYSYHSSGMVAKEEFFGDGGHYTINYSYYKNGLEDTVITQYDNQSRIVMRYKWE